MSDRLPWEENRPRLGGGAPCCEEWECRMADALDRSLSLAGSAAFEQHSRECAACARMLEEAGRGMAWLEFLEGDPEMRPDLVREILARTGRAASPEVAAPARTPPPRLVWSHIARPAAGQMIERRLMMTAAMAFFSLAVTLNVTGIKLQAVHLSGLLSDLLSDLRPSALQSGVTRQYYSANKQIMKYYEDLRFVYEMEATVRDLSRSVEEARPAAQPASPQNSAPPSNGSSGIQTIPATDAGHQPAILVNGKMPAIPNLRRRPRRGDGQQTAGRQMINAAGEWVLGPKSLLLTFARSALRGKMAPDEAESEGCGGTTTGKLITGSRTEDQAERSLV